MDELDDLLRTTFAAREREAVDAGGPAEAGGPAKAAGLADAARAGYARRTAKRRQVLAVGTVGVLAVGGSSALALARHGSGPRPANLAKANPATRSGDSLTPTGLGSVPSKGGPTTSASPAVPRSDSAASGGGAVPPKGVSTADPLPVAGSRAWSSHGLQIRVPEKWKANRVRCGTPTEDTVLIGGGAVADCLINPQPRVNSVAFDTATNLDLHGLPALHAATIGGKPAQAGTGVLADGRTVTVMVMADLDVSVVVKGSDPHFVAQIAATAQLVDVDANGCATRVDSVEPAGPPTVPGAQDTMVPGKPVKAIVCHYGNGWAWGQAAADGSPILLTNGSEIASDQVAGLAGILNTLKPGLATWQGLAGSCASPARDGYVFRFSYASGPPVDVYLHTSDCEHEGFSNGAVTGLIPKAFADNSQKYLPDMGVEISGEAMAG